MKTHAIFALIAFILSSFIAGFTGSVILIEFAMSTYDSGTARFGILICIVFIVSLLAAIVLPVLCMIQGLSARLESRLLIEQKQ